MTTDAYFSGFMQRPNADQEELYFGEIRTVLAPSVKQLQLFSHVAIHLGSQLRASTYQIQTDQVRIWVPSAESVRACGGCMNEGLPLYHPLDTQRSAFGNPRLIMDFPQHSEDALRYTQDFHSSYSQLASLRVYLLIYQQERRIDVWMRETPLTSWEQFELSDLHHELSLPVEAITLDLKELYDDAHA